FTMTALDASKTVAFEFTGVANTTAAEDNPMTPEDESIPVTSIKTLTSGTPLQAAQPAMLIVNGVTVTRPTNEIKDLITGVTLNLTSVDKTTLTIGRDVD